MRSGAAFEPRSVAGTECSLSWEILAGLKPLVRRACRTSKSLPSTTFRRRHSSWDGPGMVLSGEGTARQGFFCAFRGCGSAFGL